jgi:hypothetical protein
MKKLLGIQSLILLCGTIFAWSKLIPQFSNFQSLYGTLFRFSGCAIPNPLLTACLYGSTAFLIALFWSCSLYRKQKYVSERRLRNFLLFCVIFAASVVLYEAADYYKLFVAGTISVSCSPGVSPLQTPCFYGMLFFIAAFITSIFATRRLKFISETAE